MISSDDIPIYLLRITAIVLVFTITSLFSATKGQLAINEYTAEENRLAQNMQLGDGKFIPLQNFSFLSVAQAVEMNPKYLAKLEAEEKASLEKEKAEKEKAEAKRIALAYAKKSSGKNGVYKITGYNAVPAQTDSSPNIAAWNDNIKGAVNVAAVTQDSPWKRGTCLEISGLPGKYLVLDRFNARYNGQKKVDILMGSVAEARAITGNRTVTVSAPGNCDLKRIVDGKVTYEKLQKKRF